MGKSFSEYIAKSFATIITMKYDLRFEDKNCYTNKPMMTVALAKPEVKFFAEKRKGF